MTLQQSQSMPEEIVAGREPSPQPVMAQADAASGAQPAADARAAAEAARLRFFREMERELHDLCQPVTSLQCRLELGKMCGGEEALQEVTDGALEDAVRIFEAVAKLRERLLLERKLERQVARGSH